MPIDLDVLLLPAFDDIEGLPGEATPWRDAYEFTDQVDVDGCPVPVQVTPDGIGLVPTGVGKTQTTATVTALLASERVALDDATVLSVGVAGGPPELPIGSVVVADAVVDWDLKCRFDPDGEGFPIADNPYAENPVYHLNETLVERTLAAAAESALSSKDGTAPVIVRGANVCGDELWHGHCMADQVEWFLSEYGVGPYRATEMEDAGTARALERFGKIDRYCCIRGIANHDRPTDGQTARESFYSEGFEEGFAYGIENAVTVARAAIRD